MKPAYLYPVTARYNSEVINPYMDDFQKSMDNEFAFLNLKSPSSSGILDLFKYYFKVQYIFLHWPENIPDRKYGTLQSLVLLFTLVLTTFSSKKIIWTMHNRVSNVRTHMFLKKVLFKNLIRFSSVIITHASDGRAIAAKISAKAEKKVLVIPHPVKTQDNSQDSLSGKEIDILIWGTIVEYKGIDRFLEFLRECGKEDTFSLYIAGKVLDDRYYSKIKALLGKKTTLVNAYLEKDELLSLAKKSKIILFPYSKDGVLSSGALMDSISWHNVILGPDVGAFSDCAERKVIFTYTDFEDLLDKVSNIMAGSLNIDPQRLNDFLVENTWDKFASKLLAFIG